MAIRWGDGNCQLWGFFFFLFFNFHTRQDLCLITIMTVHFLKRQSLDVVCTPAGLGREVRLQTAGLPGGLALETELGKTASQVWWHIPVIFQISHNSTSQW